MQGIKDFFNMIIHPVDSMKYTFKNIIVGSKYIFIIVCMVGFIMYCAKIKKGRDISVGSVIIYATLRIVASCL